MDPVMLKQLAAHAYANREVMAQAAIHLAAGAFIVAALMLWIRRGVRRMRIVRASREAERQLRALRAGGPERTRKRVVSERKEAA